MSSQLNSILQEEISHRERAAWDGKGWTPTKIAAEKVSIHRGRHENELEVRACGQQITKDDKQEIPQCLTLVHLINDNMTEA